MDHFEPPAAADAAELLLVSSGVGCAALSTVIDIKAIRPTVPAVFACQSLAEGLVGHAFSANDGARVELVTLPESHPFGRIRLTDNIVQFETTRYASNPLVVQGPGAGPDVTAAGIFADVLRLASYVGATR